MKICLSLLCLILSVISISAQNITLISTGNGVTKENATENALINALEQAFTTFVSDDMSLFNDQFVRNEIAKTSTGNVRSSKELYTVKKANSFDVTVSATIAVNKLIDYAKSHGSATEIASQTYDIDKLTYDLKKRNEAEALDNLLIILNKSGGNLFSGDIDALKAEKKGDKYIVPIDIIVYTNDNFLKFKDLLFETLSALSLSAQEFEYYDRSGEKYYMISKKMYPNQGDGKYINQLKNEFFYLRNDRNVIEKFLDQVTQILDRSFRNVKITEIGESGKSAFIAPGELKFSVILNHGNFADDKSHKDDGAKSYFVIGPMTPLTVYGERIPDMYAPQELRFERNHKLYSGKVYMEYPSNDAVKKVKGYEVIPSIRQNGINEMYLTDEGKMELFLISNKIQYTHENGEIRIPLKYYPDIIIDCEKKIFTSPDLKIEYTEIVSDSKGCVIKQGGSPKASFTKSKVKVNLRNGSSETYKYK